MSDSTPPDLAGFEYAEVGFNEEMRAAVYRQQGESEISWSIAWAKIAIIVVCIGFWSLVVGGGVSMWNNHTHAVQVAEYEARVHQSLVDMCSDLITDGSLEMSQVGCEAYFQHEPLEQ